ncbi:hypothetical protein SAMN06297251_10122 [Fulvimarina manganoxydans]|uniref:Uncharacterized protein n=1 Tax=Fulvimarina manganoxydans TaxID=937218 RepID=A0A1W1Y9E0_9HYPH|nr:hypothetical protein [Fulvimarina manganoxydans]SMC32358.1 hypothetical protein SAMN06297251_10122 [Fulvimarina manganoxydans]
MVDASWSNRPLPRMEFGLFTDEAGAPEWRAIRAIADLEAAAATSKATLNEIRSRGAVAPAGASRQVRRRLERNGGRDAGYLGAVDRAKRDLRNAEDDLRDEKLRRAGVVEKPTLVRPSMNIWQRWQREA